MVEPLVEMETNKPVADRLEEANPLIVIVLPAVERVTAPKPTRLEEAGAENSALCAPFEMVSAPPATDITTVPEVKVELLAAIATPPAAPVVDAGPK